MICIRYDYRINEDPKIIAISNYHICDWIFLLLINSRMPRPRSARSDTSDGDAEGMADKLMERARLQRQYRLMDGDRMAYCQETQDDIKRQKYDETSTIE